MLLKTKYFHWMFWGNTNLFTTICQTIEMEGFRRIWKDLRGFYSISTASFVMWIDFSAHNYLETFQDLRLGFPKTPLLLEIQQDGDSWRTVERCSRWPSHLAVAHFLVSLRVPSLLFQRFVTSRYLVGFSKIRTFWEAKTQNLKCLKVVMCRKFLPRYERYRWKSSKSVLACLSTC